MKREIRPLKFADIEAYLDIYLNAYPAFKNLDDECRAHYREKITLELKEDKEVKCVGLFEGDTLISIMKIVHFSMNIYGKMQLACGLMSLAVHPLHKKKGAALQMVHYFEEHAKMVGALVTLLLPFSISFYRRMGYGFGAKIDEYHIPTTSIPKAENLENLVLLKIEDLSKVLECHSSFAKNNHGMLEKFEEEIRDMEKDTQVRRIGYWSEGKLKGYLAFRFENGSKVNYTQNRILVKEMVYENGEVLKSLLGFLRLQADLAQTVVLRTGEEDFYHLLEDPQDVSGNYIPFGFLQTNVSAIGTMFKILSPKDFVKQTSYRKFPKMQLVAQFIYENELIHQQEALTLQFSCNKASDTGKWSIADKDVSADVTLHCKEGDLASLLLGSCNLSSMVRLGTIKISNSTFTEQLDQLLHYMQKPWSNADY
nr:GNAT family N-acetyltransferase [uncultured Aminipila sp.]